MTCTQIEGARSSHPRNECPKISCRDSRHEEMPNESGVVRGHSSTIGATVAKRIGPGSPPRARCRGTVLLCFAFRG